MNFKVLPTPLFERELKKLSKRYTSIKSDLAATIVSLKKNPTLGESLGNNCFTLTTLRSWQNATQSSGYVSGMLTANWFTQGEQEDK